MTHETTKLSELLPCPFCGGGAQLITKSLEQFYVCCLKSNCAASVITGSWLGKGRAVREWNTRDNTAIEHATKGLVEALEFYKKEWQMNADGDFSTPGLSRSWYEPTDKLWDDAGRKAEEALAAHRKATQGETV